MATRRVPAHLIARRRAALAEHLPHALEGAPTSVHQARVASRRLRELLPVVVGALPARKQRRLERRLRRLTRLLGLVRELDVTVATLDRAMAGHSGSDDFLVRLHTRLLAERTEAAAALAAGFDAGRAARLVGRLERVEAALAGTAVLPAWQKRLAGRVRRRAQALQRRVADAGAIFDSERLHAVRIAAKKLRYALELAGESRIVATGALVRTLKDAQDALGALHDIDVLLAYARRGAAANAGQAAAAGRDAASRDDRPAGAVWLEGVLTAETRRLHGKYLRRQPKLIAAADRALDAVAPRVEAAAAEAQPPVAGS